jgi:hypothetical protein
MAIETRHRTAATSRGAIARILFLIASVAFVALPALSIRAAGGFTDPQARFAFDLPDGWQEDTAASNSGLIVQYLTANPDGAFSVTAAPLPDGVTVDAAVQAIGARLQQQFNDYQQTNTGPASVAGEQGVELDYTATNGDGTLLAVSQVIVPHNGTLYLLTMAAQPPDIGAVQSAAAPILTSWRWLP